MQTLFFFSFNKFNIVKSINILLGLKKKNLWLFQDHNASIIYFLKKILKFYLESFGQE